MKARDFIYWFQGALELGELKGLNEKQVKVVQEHLEMVFIEEIDPSFGPEKQQALQDAHDGVKPPRINPPRIPGYGGKMKC